MFRLTAFPAIIILGTALMCWIEYKAERLFDDR